MPSITKKSLAFHIFGPQKESSGRKALAFSADQNSPKSPTSPCGVGSGPFITRGWTCESMLRCESQFFFCFDGLLGGGEVLQIYSFVFIVAPPKNWWFHDKHFE